MCAGFPGGSDGKESACNAGDPHSITGWAQSPGEGNGNPLQWSCREFHRQRSPAGYGPWGCKESDMTKWLTHTHTHTHTQIYLSKIIWNCWVYKNGNFIYFNSWVIVEYIFSHLFLLGSVSSFPTSTLPCLYQLYSALLTYPQAILFSLAIHIHNHVCISLHTHGIMNSGLLHCRQILSCLSHQGRPRLHSALVCPHVYLHSSWVVFGSHVKVCCVTRLLSLGHGPFPYF